MWIDQEPFLKRAFHTDTWKGLCVGVLKGSGFRSETAINFHGLVVKARLPQVSMALEGGAFHVRIEVINCPQLKLVLPARKEVVQDSFFEELQVAVNRTIYWAIVLLAVSPAWAEPAPPPDDLEAIAKAASILHMQGGANPLLRDLAEQADDIARSKLPQSPMIEKGKVILFVSASLGDEALKQAFRAGSGDPNVTIVFRGFLSGEKLTDVIKRLGALFGDIDPRPNIAINPKSFRDHRVTVVPTFVELATGKRISGTILAKTFLDRAEQNGGIDLGTVGPVSEIVEPDLTELIKEKAATIDVATRAKEKVASYWRRAPFVDVPKASPHCSPGLMASGGELWNKCFATNA